MAPWASARSNGAGPRRYTPAAQRPSTAPGDAPPPCGGGLESPYSLGQLFEHRLVQLRLGKQLLQPGVLGLQLLEPLGVTGLMPAQVRLQRCQVDSVVSECRNTSARSLPAPSIRLPPRTLRTAGRGGCHFRFIVVILPSSGTQTRNTRTQIRDPPQDTPPRPAHRTSSNTPVIRRARLDAVTLPRNTTTGQHRRSSSDSPGEEAR